MEMIRTSGRNRVFINTDGNRFVNEGAARDVLAKAIFAQKDSTYYVLVNHLRYPSLTWVDRNGAKVGDMIDLGRVVAADTLEELAAKLKMPVENLKGSIDTYNAVVRGEKKDPLGSSPQQGRQGRPKAPGTPARRSRPSTTRWAACRSTPTHRCLTSTAR